MILFLKGVTECLQCKRCRTRLVVTDIGWQTSYDNDDAVIHVKLPAPKQQQQQQRPISVLHIGLCHPGMVPRTKIWGLESRV